AVDSPHGAEEFAERVTIAELDTVRVDVLAEEGDLDRSVVDECLHLGEDVAWSAILLLAAEGGDDAEGAGVVAADGDGDPAAVGGFAARGQRGGEGFEGFEDLDLRLAVVAGTFE